MHLRGVATPMISVNNPYYYYNHIYIYSTFWLYGYYIINILVYKSIDY